MVKAAEWCPGALAAISVPAEDFFWETAKSSKPYIESCVLVIVWGFVFWMHKLIPQVLIHKTAEHSMLWKKTRALSFQHIKC